MSTEPNTTSPSFAEQARQLGESMMTGMSDDERQKVMESLDRLMRSNVAEAAIKVGDNAPDFRLPEVRGKQVQLRSALAEGPVVLSFYRGGWCPFCNLEFKALQDRLPEMQALGARLFGISPETPDNSLSTAEKFKLQFGILSDLGNSVARDYGLVMTVDEAVRPLYLQWGLDLPAFNGDDSYELPTPATYVIDREGIVRAAYVNKDYTSRMEPGDIITALQEITCGKTKE